MTAPVAVPTWIVCDPDHAWHEPVCAASAADARVAVLTRIEAEEGAYPGPVVVKTLPQWARDEQARVEQERYDDLMYGVWA